VRLKPWEIDTVGASAGDGLVFNPDTDEYEPGTVSGGGMTDPTTTKGDLIVRGTSAPPTRLAVGPDGQVLTADAASANGVKWATPSGGGGGGGSGGALVAKQVYYDATDLKFTTTSWAALVTAAGASVGSSLDMTLSSAEVAAGDLIEVGFSGTWKNESIDGYITFGTLVSGAIVNTIYGTDRGIPGAWGSSGVYSNASGSAFYTVQAGDLSSGSLVLRPLGSGATAGTKSLLAASPNGALFWVKNWSRGGSIGGGLLATTVYNPGSLASYTTTSTTSADVDATNLAVTFVAPPSGKVIVRLSALGGISGANGQMYWGLRSGTTDLLDSQVDGLNSTQTNMMVSVPLQISGLTPGTTYTYKWSWRVVLAGSTPTGRIFAGSGAGQAIMEVQAVGTGTLSGSSNVGSSWLKEISLPLSTLTGWTAGVGTWAISSGVIRQSNTANAVNRLHLNQRFNLANCMVEVDVKLDTTPNSVSSRGGFVFGTPAAADGTNGHEISLISKSSTTQATAVDFEQDAVVNFGQVNLAANIPNGTWTTLRIYKAGNHYTVWINGSYLTSFQFGINAAGAASGYEFGRLALYSYASDVSFRNLSVWTPTVLAGSAMVLDKRFVIGSGETSVDEFNDGVIDPAWARVDSAGGGVSPAANITWSEGSDSIGGVNLGGDSTDGFHALLRPLSAFGGALIAGDAIISCLTLMPSIGGSNYSFAGLMLADGNTFGSGNQILGILGAAAAGKNLQVSAFTGFNTAAGVSSVTLTTMDTLRFVYVRLVMTAANTWRVDGSPDGVNWIKGSTISRTVTPTHVGLCSTSYGTSTKHVVSSEFLRRVAGIA
jgi:hypothetical protein